MKLKLILTTASFMAGLFFAGNWNVDGPKAKIMFSVKGPLEPCMEVSPV
jgi:hypothetical protein